MATVTSPGSLQHRGFPTRSLSGVQRGTVDGVALFALAVGLLPFAGCLVLGGWSPRELGFAAVLVLASGSALLHRG
jgi:hypothetical protein